MHSVQGPMWLCQDTPVRVHQHSACAPQAARLQACTDYHAVLPCVQGRTAVCPHAEAHNSHDELPAPQQLKDMVVQAQKNILEVNKARLIALHELRQAKERIAELGAPAALDARVFHSVASMAARLGSSGSGVLGHMQWSRRGPISASHCARLQRICASRTGSTCRG